MDDHPSPLAQQPETEERRILWNILYDLSWCDRKSSGWGMAKLFLELEYYVAEGHTTYFNSTSFQEELQSMFKEFLVWASPYRDDLEYEFIEDLWDYAGTRLDLYHSDNLYEIYRVRVNEKADECISLRLPRLEEENYFSYRDRLAVWYEERDEWRRITGRCAAVKEELMKATAAPERIKRLVAIAGPEILDEL